MLVGGQVREAIGKWRMFNACLEQPEAPVCGDPACDPAVPALQVGMVWFFTQAIMSIGLPFALVVAPMHLWR